MLILAKHNNFLSTQTGPCIRGLSTFKMLLCLAVKNIITKSTQNEIQLLLPSFINLQSTDLIFLTHKILCRSRFPFGLPHTTYGPAIFYWWDQQAIGVGKGGRLGTIAFLGNLLYYSAVVRGGLGKLLGSTLEIFCPLTAVVLALSASALHFARTTPAAVAAAADKSHDYRSGESIYPMTRDPNNLRRLAQASKMVILFAVAARLWTSSTVGITNTVVPSLLSMILAALTVQNSAGVVLPVALVGLLGSIVTPALATSVYLGAFVGMTKLARFGLTNTVQACTLATLLLHLGVVDGFGGKLGVLSFLGVLFGM